MLDLSAGTYDVTDEVGAAMWALLALQPGERDIAGLADTYGVSPATVEADFMAFGAAQLAAGRLVAEPPGVTPPSVAPMPRRKPTVLCAWRERAGAERDLRKDFASAYARRIRPMADTTAPRADAQRVQNLFRTAEGFYPAREAPLDCLPRSLALTRFLRTAGWPAQHVIGVALYPFEAHAWVELDGLPVNEGGTFLRRFAVIQRA